jgi:hypothetical protein
VTSDNRYNLSYREYMEHGGAYITLKLDLSEPVEALDFAQAFSSLAVQFDEYLKDNHPDLVGEAKIYITEVKQGSIIVDMIPWIKEAIGYMDNVTIVAAFGSLLSKRVRAYLHGNFIEPFTKPNLHAVASLIRAVAKDKGGSAQIETARYEQGFWHKKLEISFSTKEARKGLETIESHKRVLELTANADHQRVTMTFVRSSIMEANIGKKTGELVCVESISSKGLPLVYASSLAEQQIKHEIREADENVFKKAFIVDANVELRNGKPIAYRVTNLHQVIDLENED